MLKTYPRTFVTINEATTQKKRSKRSHKYRTRLRKKSFRRLNNFSPPIEQPFLMRKFMNYICYPILLQMEQYASTVPLLDFICAMEPIWKNLSGLYFFKGVHGAMTKILATNAATRRLVPPHVCVGIFGLRSMEGCFQTKPNTTLNFLIGVQCLFHTAMAHLLLEIARSR